MMKKLLALLLALLTVAALSACSDKNEQNELEGFEKENDVIYTSVTIGTDVFQFEILDAQNVVITGYSGVQTLHAITIPQTVKTGISDSSVRNVAAIGDNAFSAVSSITSVVIPEGVETIGSQAFSDCLQLTSVTLPASLKSIGNAAFYNCGLTAISFPENSALTSLPESAFSKCMSLTEVTIPGHIKTIGRCAFYGCENIAKIVISEGVETIEKQAFQKTYALADLELPSTFTNTDPLEDLVFSGSEVLYRDHIVCNGDAAKAYADKMPIEATNPNPPVEEA